MLSIAKRLLVLSGTFVVACSSPSLSRRAVPTSKFEPCVIADQNLSAKATEAITELQRIVESGPFYTIAVSRSGPGSCRAAFEAAVISLEYNFPNGAWLKVKRDSRIEYNDQELRFQLPPEENPIDLLK